LEQNRHATGVGAMFDGIAARYDAVNRLLSLRRDQRWRAVTARLVAAARPRRVLDIATGTGDLLLAVARADTAADVAGIDIAGSMLRLGRSKARRLGVADRVSFQVGDATNLPFADGSFEATTIAFGLRNVADRHLALREMLRVLAPGGRALILEFSLPAVPILRSAYLVYFRHVLPLLGGIIAGNISAYRYLNRTVERFASTDLVAMMLAAGFLPARRIALTFGVASVYVGYKRGAAA
jgi:demethylmenaquinone methyltransferase/2-methoxy-6-polyprenyl-1,4-benzoquinol methylase